MEEVKLDSYRTGYVAEKHDLPDNAARALQLFEIGYSTSGAAKHLPVTESTVASYKRKLSDAIGERALFPVSSSARDGSLDVWGDRYISEYEDLGYEDGVADARGDNSQKTDRQSQLDPEFREPETPLNKGASIAEIDEELISLDL